MKIVVIGGTGLMGSMPVTKLRQHGHEAVAASPDSGVDTLIGEGRADALEGAPVLMDAAFVTARNSLVSGIGGYSQAGARRPPSPSPAPARRNVDGYD